MDPFDDLLRGVRGDGAVFGRSVLSPPWALRFTDGASLTLCLPMRGTGWIVPESDGTPRAVRVGEAAIVRGPEPFVFADDPASARRAELVRDVRCGEAVGPPGGGLSGGAVLLAGAYTIRDHVPQQLLRVLPPLAVVPDDHDCESIRDYLEAQLDGARPGRRIVLDRLLDWLLVCTLRDWFDRPEAASPRWYGALADAVVGPALRAIHRAPERPWTLAALAAEAGTSRTTLARRFTDLVGRPPLAYLTEWRMTVAADLLADPSATVAAVARRVGYADAFGFSTAFKRVFGTSPSVHRGDGEARRIDAPAG